MRAKEFITDAAKQRLDSKCWKGWKKSGTKMKGGIRVNNCVKVNKEATDNTDNVIEESSKVKKLRKSAASAIPGMRTFSKLDNNNSPYLAYRFGVALATSPDGDMDATTEFGSDFTMIDYTEADGDIRKHAEKVIGVKSAKKTSDKSTEISAINKTSPVAAPKRNKYGI